MDATIPIPILQLRGQPVILDADLARLYGVATKRLNEQVRRNKDRFPEDFHFQLSFSEASEVVAKCDLLRRAVPRNLRSQIATSSLKSFDDNGLHEPKWGGRRYLPFAFTEHGALMAANVLNSPEAVKMSVFIIRAFVKQREELTANQAILRRLAEIDQSLLLHDAALRDLYHKLLPLLSPPPPPPRRAAGFGAGEA